jgi:hypothetical protein
MTQPEDLALSDHLEPDERDPEAPEADAVEQARPVDPTLEEPAVSQSLEAPEWDAQEQAHVVTIEDDYR